MTLMTYWHQNFTKWALFRNTEKVFQDFVNGASIEAKMVKNGGCSISLDSVDQLEPKLHQVGTFPLAHGDMMSNWPKVASFSIGLYGGQMASIHRNLSSMCRKCL